MIQYREISWWYWAVTSVLLIAGLAGWWNGLSARGRTEPWQIIHFRLREGQLLGLPGTGADRLYGHAATCPMGADALAVLGAGDRYTGAGSVRLLHLGALSVAVAVESG